MTCVVFAKNEKELKEIVQYTNEHHIVEYKLKKSDTHPDKLKKADCVIVANPTSFHNANVRMYVELLDYLYENNGRFICVEPSIEITLSTPQHKFFAVEFFNWYEYFNTFFDFDACFNGE